MTTREPVARSIESITESPLFKLTVPIITTALAALVIGMGNRLVDRLDRVETLLATSQTDRATMDLRLKAVEGLVPERGAAIRTLNDKVLMLEFKVEDLQRQLPTRKP